MCVSAVQIILDGEEQREGREKGERRERGEERKRESTESIQ